MTQQVQPQRPINHQRREAMLKFQRNTVLDQLADAEGHIGYLEEGINACQGRISELERQIEATRQESYERGLTAGQLASYERGFAAGQLAGKPKRK